MDWMIQTPEETGLFAKKLASFLKRGDVISLIGDLGVGKTTLTQFLAKEFGVTEQVTSPTFQLVYSYEGNLPFHHLDLYRLESPEEVEALDIDMLFYPDGITVIEWAEKADGYLPRHMIELYLERTENDVRVFHIYGNNPREQQLIGEYRENS